jgi:hypothetical protein
MPDPRLQDIARRDLMARTVDGAASVYQFLGRWVAPWLDLVIRLRLAQLFFVSAVVKLANWDNALYLSAHEYPVAWMDPVVAAYVGVAPAAKQAGEHVAKLIRARLEGRSEPGPFVYRHLGSLATIGRKAAVVDFGWIRLRGALAWWFWGAVHVGFLVDVRSRLSVMFDWLWAYLTYRSGTRLITGSGPAMSSPTTVPACADTPREYAVDGPPIRSDFIKAGSSV